MGATPPPTPKSRRRSPAQPRRAAAAAAPRPQIAQDERIGVAHLTAEYWPFARTGGLGEAVSGLATCQAAAGLPTTVFMPLYQIVRETTPSLERTGSALAITFGGHTERAWLYRTPPGPGGGPQVFFIEHPDFFDRAGIYGDNGADYPDNARRFAFFCLAALTALPEVAPETQVLHAHDWHTALAPVYLRTAFANEPFHRRLAVVMSVHNAGFQGHFPPETMGALGLPAELYNSDVFEWYGRMNALKGGMAHSNVVVTVSPSHAEELRTAEGGFGLHDRFTALGDRLVGILNGIDPDLWNPETDPELTGTYSSEDLSGKRRCKAALQRAYGLAQRAHTPLFGAVPVARRVGGLKDSIIDGVSGFLFDEYSPAALAQAIRRAIDAYADRTVWRKLVRGAMAQQFGWHRSGEQYFALYGRALAVRSASLSR